MIYVLNICTITKNTDRYDKVAVNKFPIIISCPDRESLNVHLGSAEVADFVKESLKLKHLYESAVFYIREIGENMEIHEFCLNVSELTPVEYS